MNILRCIPENPNLNDKTCQCCDAHWTWPQPDPVCRGQCIVTVRQVYGKPLVDLKAPKGWEFTGGFRFPTDCNEVYLNRAGQPDSCLVLLPVLILCKRQPQRIVFEEDPQGDWVERDGCFRRAVSETGVLTFPYLESVTRYTRREEPQT